MRQRVPLRADVLTHEVTDADEVVLYDSNRKELLVLNDIGAGIWLLIDGKRSVEELAKAVLDFVDADGETVAQDVSAFVEALTKRNLVRWGPH